MFAAQAPYGTLTLELELPFNRDDLKGAVEQARLKVREAKAQRDRILIEVDLRAALQRVLVATERLRISREAERLAAANVDAQRRKFEAGEATTFDVLRTQDDYARAQAETFEARIGRAITVVQLEAVRGTLIDRFGIHLEDVDSAR